MTIKTCVAAALASLCFHGPAQAVAIQAVSANRATISPFTLIDLGNSFRTGFVSDASVAIAGGVITFGSTGSSASGIYHGNANTATSPYGSTQLSQRNYLAAEPGSAITFNFSAPQTQFQLLWGTIDSYNSLVFTRTDGTSLTITGNDILAADGGASSAFVTISDVGSFRSVTASSTSPAFEFAPGTGTAVPEPASLAIVAAGIGGLLWARRRYASKP